MSTAFWNVLVTAPDLQRNRWSDGHSSASDTAQLTAMEQDGGQCQIERLLPRAAKKGTPVQESAPSTAKCANASSSTRCPWWMSASAETGAPAITVFLQVRG